MPSKAAAAPPLKSSAGLFGGDSDGSDTGDLFMSASNADAATKSGAAAARGAGETLLVAPLVVPTFSEIPRRKRTIFSVRSRPPLP